MAVTSGKIGSTTTLTWHGDSPLELTRIGSVNLTATKVDSTTLGTANYYKEFIPGLLDPGDVEIEGIFRPDDAGTILLKTDMEARTSQAFTIAFPTALSTTTWTGTAYITAFSAGDATPEGMIPFTATMSIVGKPTLGVTASTGMATCTVVDSAAGTPVFVPVFAIGVFTYSMTVATNAITYIKLTPTAAAHTITITNAFDSSIQTITSGDQSAALTLGAADTVTLMTVKVVEALHSPKYYYIYVARPA